MHNNSVIWIEVDETPVRSGVSSERDARNLGCRLRLPRLCGHGRVSLHCHVTLHQRRLAVQRSHRLSDSPYALPGDSGSLFLRTACTVPQESFGQLLKIYKLIVTPFFVQRALCLRNPLVSCSTYIN